MLPVPFVTRLQQVKLFQQRVESRVASQPCKAPVDVDVEDGAVLLRFRLFEPVQRRFALPQFGVHFRDVERGLLLEGTQLVDRFVRGRAVAAAGLDSAERRTRYARTR